MSEELLRVRSGATAHSSEDHGLPTTDTRFLPALLARYISLSAASMSCSSVCVSSVRGATPKETVSCRLKVQGKASGRYGEQLSQFFGDVGERASSEDRPQHPDEF